MVGGVVTLVAQTPEPAFDVLSIKQNVSGSFPRGSGTTPGSVVRPRGCETRAQPVNAVNANPVLSQTNNSRPTLNNAVNDLPRLVRLGLVLTG